MDFAALREQMVREQLAGPGRRLTHARTLAAMARVPRHEFVPAELVSRAYTDRALPIGEGQTISQPYIVGLMTSILDPQPTDRILEIGTGSGYQTAILAELASEVYSIEVVPAIAQRTAGLLRRLGYGRLHLRLGDGHRGWPEAAPFDGIIVTCAPEEVPRDLVDQLAEGGRLVVPTGPSDHQQLQLFTRRGNRLDEERLLAVRFVPMVGGRAG